MVKNIKTEFFFVSVLSFHNVSEILADILDSIIILFKTHFFLFLPISFVHRQTIIRLIYIVPGIRILNSPREYFSKFFVVVSW